MAFNSLIALAAAEATLQLGKAGELNVMELGNQRFRINSATLQRISKNHGISIEQLKGGSDEPTALGFYKALGFSEYTAIDVNSERNSIPMDLNMDIQKKYQFYNQYSLVTNNGTGEHVFDQAAVFRNMHNLTKVGGIMINLLPMTTWINHGFFNFNPVLFRDLAYANNYEWCFLWLGNNEGSYMAFDPDDADAWSEQIWNLSYYNPSSAQSEPDTRFKRLLKRIYNKLSTPPQESKQDLYYGEGAGSLAHYTYERAIKQSSNKLEQYLASTLVKEPFNISVVAAYRRTSPEPFVIPFTGKYVSAIKDRDILQSYKSQPDTLEIHEGSNY